MYDDAKHQRRQNGVWKDSVNLRAKTAFESKAMSGESERLEAVKMMRAIEHMTVQNPRR